MSVIIITAKIIITKSNNTNPLFSALDFFLKNRFIIWRCKNLTGHIKSIKCTKKIALLIKQNALC